MKRWRIVRTESFLQLSALVAPILAAPLASTALQVFWLFQNWRNYSWEAPNILAMIVFAILFAIPALVVGAIVGFVPGLASGGIVLLLSRLRPLNFIEVAIVGVVVSGGFGWLLSGASRFEQGPEFAALFAGSGLAATWIAAVIARRRGIVLPADSPVEAAPLPPDDYDLLGPRRVERPWALVRLAALWTPLAAGMIGVLMLTLVNWRSFNLDRAATLVPAMAFGSYGGLIFGILPGLAVAITILLFEDRKLPLSVLQAVLVGATICAFAAWLPAHWGGRGGIDWVSPLFGAIGGSAATAVAGLVAIRLRILGPPLPRGG